MSDSSRPARSGVRLFLMAAALVLVAVSVYMFLAGRSARLKQEAAEASFERMTGLTTPVKNRLDPKFADADGDLLADPPSAPEALIDPPTLYFSYIAEEDPEPGATAWAGFVKYLSEQTGKPVEYLRLSDTQEQVKALAEGKLHVTGLNTGNVPIAVNLIGFVPVAKVTGPDGLGQHRMQIIVRPDSTIKTCADLKGRELALTDVGSNSGYHAPLVLLKRDFNLMPPKDYLVRYSGGHRDSIEGIASKKYEAAAVASDMLERLIGAGVIKKEQFRSIYSSDPFPNASLGYLVALKPELAAKVKAAILSYPWKGTPLEAYFAASNQTGLVPVSYKEDWAAVRGIHDAAGYAYTLK